MDMMMLSGHVAMFCLTPSMVVMMEAMAEYFVMVCMVEWFMVWWLVAKV